MNRERMSADDIATLIGVTRSTVHSYAARGQMPKPSPCPCCGSSSWDRADIVAWQQTRPGRTGRPRKDAP